MMRCRHTCLLRATLSVALLATSASRATSAR
jgi:hypothetical protein